MPLKRCENFHLYDPEKHSRCPFCGIPGLWAGETRQASEANADPPPIPAEATPPSPVDQETVYAVEKATGFDLVVGWLVCTAGPERGQDYRLRSERNRIGRDPALEVCIATDPTISRSEQAQVTYDPRRNAFHLAPGQGRGPVYLNGEPLLGPAPLRAHDQMELGETRLLFVPLCGEGFSWG